MRKTVNRFCGNIWKLLRREEQWRKDGTKKATSDARPARNTLVLDCDVNGGLEREGGGPTLRCPPDSTSSKGTLVDRGAWQEVNASLGQFLTPFHAH